jgi:hypothetical protein
MYARLDIYGSGMEYHNLHAAGALKEFAVDRAASIPVKRKESKTPHRLMGYVPYHESMAAMSQSLDRSIYPRGDT